MPKEVLQARRHLARQNWCRRYGRGGARTTSAQARPLRSRYSVHLSPQPLQQSFVFKGRSGRWRGCTTPRIVPVVDAGSDPDVGLFFVMELQNGLPLHGGAAVYELARSLACP